MNSAQSASVNLKDLTISSFPDDGSYWRVDWMGDVRFPDRSIRAMQPSIFTYLSPLRHPSDVDRPDRLNRVDITDVQQQRGLWLSIGQLALVQVGDIWHQQKLVARPDYTLETFEQVNIGETTATVVKAGVSFEPHQFLIPFSDHPWHRSSTESYCVSVTLGDGRRLVVPCLELIRFYFGSSSKLLRALFTPPLTRKALTAKPAAYGFWGNATEIVLAEGMSKASAADIARIVLSDDAWWSAYTVGHSLLMAGMTNASTRNPICRFPFKGTTTLTASGRWLPLGGRADQTFIVYSLRSCSAHFPFKALRYSVHNSSAGSRRSGGPMAEGDGDSRQRYIKSARVGTRLSDQDPSSTLASKNIFIRADKFPDLHDKPVRSLAMLAPQKPPASAGSTSLVDSIADGVGASSRTTRSVDIQLGLLQERLLREEPPEFLRAYLKIFANQRDLQFQVLTQDGEDGWTHPLPWLVDDDGEIRPRLFVRETGRMRRMCVLGTEYRTAKFHVFIIEDSPPSLIVRECPSEIGETEAAAIIERVVKAFESNVWLRFVRPEQVLKSIRQHNLAT